MNNNQFSSPPTKINPGQKNSTSEFDQVFKAHIIHILLQILSENGEGGNTDQVILTDYCNLDFKSR